MRHLKTENCVVCEEKAICWHGHVIAKERMALGNLVDKKVVAGFCENHAESFEYSKEDGNYGDYNKSTMGNCIPLF